MIWDFKVIICVLSVFFSQINLIGSLKSAEEIFNIMKIWFMCLFLELYYTPILFLYRFSKMFVGIILFLFVFVSL